MNLRKIYIFFVLIFSCPFVQGQSVHTIVAQIELDSVIKTVRELSGEDLTIINDSIVRIMDRSSKKGHDDAGDYIIQRLKSYGLEVQEYNYRTGGRNITGTLKGKSSPDSVLIYGAHYDAVTFFAADDNASGCAAVLEAARLLSNQCLINTIVFAFWDEEERGIVGSGYYADTAYAHGDGIIAVLNSDMLGYDKDSNSVFDIHTNNDPRNQQLKDTILYLLDTLNLKLVPNIMNPGTNRSDHASFWKKGIPAIFVMENFLGGEPYPYYHTHNDRIRAFNIGYYHELVKLAVGAVTQLAGFASPERTKDTIVTCRTFSFGAQNIIVSGSYTDTFINYLGCDSISTIDLTVVNINNNVRQNGRILSTVDSGGTFQWHDCNNVFAKLKYEIKSSYTVIKDGRYAVVITQNGCKDTSDCINMMVSGIEEPNWTKMQVFPNPTLGSAEIKFDNVSPNIQLEVYNAQGQIVQKAQYYYVKHIPIKINQERGLYYIKLVSPKSSRTFKLMKY